jgi:cold shock CspA family protein
MEYSVQQLRYIGRIFSVPGDDGFAFIGIPSVTKEDGSPHGLPTEHDIFLHNDDCASELVAGMEVIFDVVDDRRREGAFRATGATEYNPPAMLPLGELAIPA